MNPAVFGQLHDWKLVGHVEDIEFDPCMTPDTQTYKRARKSPHQMASKYLLKTEEENETRNEELAKVQVGR